MRGEPNIRIAERPLGRLAQANVREEGQVPSDEACSVLMGSLEST